MQISGGGGGGFKMWAVKNWGHFLYAHIFKHL